MSDDTVNCDDGEELTDQEADLEASVRVVCHRDHKLHYFEEASFAQHLSALVSSREHT